MLALTLFSSLVLAFPQTSPPLPAAHPRVAPVAAVAAPGTLRAIVVKSWSNGQASGWATLATEWPSHGSVPIQIDTTTLGGAVSFSYEDLASSGAEVVILSDPAGGNRQFSPEEVAALERYATEGHNLIATFKTFRWNDVDNTDLAPLFGLRAELAYDGTANVPISNDFFVRERTLLTRGLPEFAGSRLHWRSTGYSFTEVPRDDRTWNPSDLAGARIVAQCDAARAIVSLYKAPTYAGIFLSNMPEYFGGFLDRRLLYNAITHPRPGS